MGNVDNILELKPNEFINFLKEKNIRRFYFTIDEQKNKITSSHEVLKPIAEFLENDNRDFSKHEGLFFQLSDRFNTLQSAFIHRTNRGQAAGGVRYWHYRNVEDFLRDGLRLSKGMTHKNALAGLWWGGGKGVMWHNPGINKYDPETREVIYKEYGEFISSLNGCYVTAEDVGTNVNDMSNIFSRTRFTTCIPEKLGGSGNPSIPTARGVISGMEAALKFCVNDTLEGKTVVVQGVGNVGSPLIKFLLQKNVKRIIAHDINQRNLDEFKNNINNEKVELTLVKPGDFSFTGIECDIIAPCATGAIINPRTIPEIKAKIICGAANNQLEDSARDSLELQKLGIIYIPDFLTNRMGIVNCANEQYGYITDDPYIEKHFGKDWNCSIYNTALKVLEESKSTGDTTADVAVRLAEKLSMETHPIFGHRGKLIIESVIRNNWVEMQ